MLYLPLHFGDPLYLIRHVVDIFHLILGIPLSNSTMNAKDVCYERYEGGLFTNVIQITIGKYSNDISIQVLSITCRFLETSTVPQHKL